MNILTRLIITAIISIIITIKSFSQIDLNYYGNIQLTNNYPTTNNYPCNGKIGDGSDFSIFESIIYPIENKVHKQYLFSYDNPLPLSIETVTVVLQNKYSDYKIDFNYFNILNSISELSRLGYTYQLDDTIELDDQVEQIHIDSLTSLQQLGINQNIESDNVIVISDHILLGTNQLLRGRNIPLNNGKRLWYIQPNQIFEDNVTIDPFLVIHESIHNKVNNETSPGSDPHQGYNDSSNYNIMNNCSPLSIFLNTQLVHDLQDITKNQFLQGLCNCTTTDPSGDYCEYFEESTNNLAAYQFPLPVNLVTLELDLDAGSTCINEITKIREDIVCLITDIPLEGCFDHKLSKLENSDSSELEKQVDKLTSELNRIMKFKNSPTKEFINERSSLSKIYEYISNYHKSKERNIPEYFNKNNFIDNRIKSYHEGQIHEGLITLIDVSSYYGKSNLRKFETELTKTLHPEITRRYFELKKNQLKPISERE